MMRYRKFTIRAGTALLLWSVIAGLLSGCGKAGGNALLLDEGPFSHPSGVFTIPIPTGWSVVADDREPVVWLYGPESEGHLSVVMIAEALQGNTEAEMSQAAQDLLEGYMRDFLPDEDYEIYNSAEIRVARNPAILLDMARPEDGGYDVGRMVLVYIPGYLVFLAGFGPRDRWEAFLPTFREMVDGMVFSVESLPLAE